MSLTLPLTTPLFEGASATSALVPGAYDCALNGRPYMIDWKFVPSENFADASIALLKPQQDNAGNITEASLNPEDFPRRGVDSWHKGAGQCLTPETRVLTTDLRWVPCGDLRVGDGLVAFEEEATTRRARQWRAGEVVDTGIITMPCYQLLLSDGTKIIASHNHKWLREHDRSYGWLETSRVRDSYTHGKRATKFVKVFEPWDEDHSWGARYLAAAFDGEGCLTQTARPPRKDRLMLSFAQRENPMLAEVKSELAGRGFKFSESAGGGTHGDVVHLNVLGGTAELLRFLGSIRPRRLLDKFQPLNNGVMQGQPVEVVECEFIGEQEVVALQTSTKTFITEGFATHNTYFDRSDSDPARFRASKGWNPWEKWKLSLLSDTDQKRSSVNTNLQVVPVGGYLYLVDGTALLYTQDITPDSPTWTTVTGTPGGSLLSLASDGYNVYVTDGANIYQGTRGGASVAAWSTFDSTLLAYVKGRFMSANLNVASNITAAGTKTDVVTHPNTDFRWVGFAEGTGQIYMAGFSGDKSLIYRTAVKADGTALDVGVVAGELPDGEIVRSIQGYLGFVLIGTDQGVRFATASTNGDLTIGALIKLAAPVRCFEGQGRFVWFGWSNYDTVSTGLGRLDLTVLNGSAPAYASDLMVTGQGDVLSVATFQNRRVFTASALGVYAEDSTLVPSATLDTGLITFGLPDPKVAMYADLRFEPLVGTVKVSISANSGTFVDLVTANEAGSTSKATTAGESVAVTHELRLTGARSTADTTRGPSVIRVTLEANPAPGRGEFFTVPLLLFEAVKLANGQTATLNPAAEKTALVELEVAGRPITFQDGTGAQTVLLDDHKFMKHSYTKRRDGWNGTFFARLRRPRQRS